MGYTIIVVNRPTLIT